jgi:hypothetical protein
MRLIPEASALGKEIRLGGLIIKPQEPKRGPWKGTWTEALEAWRAAGSLLTRSGDPFLRLDLLDDWSLEFRFLDTFPSNVDDADARRENYRILQLIAEPSREPSYRKGWLRKASEQDIREWGRGQHFERIDETRGRLEWYAARGYLPGPDRLSEEQFEGGQLPRQRACFTSAAFRYPSDMREGKWQPPAGWIYVWDGNRKALTPVDAERDQRLVERFYRLTRWGWVPDVLHGAPPKGWEWNPTRLERFIDSRCGPGIDHGALVSFVWWKLWRTWKEPEPPGWKIVGRWCKECIRGKTNIRSQGAWTTHRKPKPVTLHGGSGNQDAEDWRLWIKTERLRTGGKEIRPAFHQGDRETDLGGLESGTRGHGLGGSRLRCGCRATDVGSKIADFKHTGWTFETFESMKAFIEADARARDPHDPYSYHSGRPPFLVAPPRHDSERVLTFILKGTKRIPVIACRQGGKADEAVYDRVADRGAPEGRDAGRIRGSLAGPGRAGRNL